MNKKKKKKRISSLYIFPVLFAIICLSYIIRFMFFNIETEVVKYDTVEKTASVQALVVRNETVTSLPAGVQANCKVKDGDRIAFGREILEVAKSDGADENIAIKIKELNNRIEEIKKSDQQNNFFPQDKEKIESNIAAKATEIKQLSKTGSVGKLSDSKESLQADLYKKSLIYGDGSFTGKNLDQLIQEKNNLEKLYKNNLDVVYAQSTGVVSYDLDGYEQVLNPANIAALNIKSVKDIFSAVEGKKSKAKGDINGVKVVDNYEWYISCVAGASEVSDLNVGKAVKLRFEELDKAEAEGKIVYISKQENGEVLVNIRINESIRNFYKYRVVKVDIIKDNYEGFVVPNKSLITRENTKGVYVVKYGLVKFIPVVILAEYDGSTLVRNLDEKEKGDSTAPVLKVFDEVITTTKMVKENQIITDNI